MPKKKMGRKPLGTAARTTRLQVKVSADDISKIEAAAAREGMVMSAWVRKIALDAAATPPKKRKRT